MAPLIRYFPVVKKIPFNTLFIRACFENSDRYMKETFTKGEKTTVKGGILLQRGSGSRK